MDTSEKLAEAFLLNCGFREVRYEPDGNVPPDFLCDGRIAVEVRRLNQTFDNGSGRKGLEETEISLRKRIHALLASLGRPSMGKSWFFNYYFGRPLPPWKKLKLEIERELRSFMATPVQQPFIKTLCAGFQIEVMAASEERPTFFLLGAHIDEESGGWVFQEIATNLEFCIREKTQKIARFREKYPAWWLVLPDRISYGLGSFDQEQFRKQISVAHDFDKIVLLDPRDHTRSFEI